MGKVIVVGSVTYAMKGKELLFKEGIRAYIEKIKKTEGFGCGYALKVNNNAGVALDILERNGFKILSVMDE